MKGYIPVSEVCSELHKSGNEVDGELLVSPYDVCPRLREELGRYGPGEWRALARKLRMAVTFIDDKNDCSVSIGRDGVAFKGSIIQNQNIRGIRPGAVGVHWDFDPDYAPVVGRVVRRDSDYGFLYD
jgi:hypothetical protein